MGIGKATAPEESVVSNDAHEVALDFAKQLITLSSGVLALSATFIRELPAATLIQLGLLALSWTALAISVYGGLQTISAIVKSRVNSDHAWSSGAGQRYATTSKLAFLVGVVLFAAFAFSLLLTSRTLDEASIDIGCSPLGA